MAKRRSVGIKKMREAWNALSEIDQRFFSTLIVLLPTIGEAKLSFSETPAALQRALIKLDRNTLFSVITKCLYLLLDEPELERLKRVHRQREAKKRLSGAKKKKRVSAAKKKRRTKKPAPKRRTTRKRPSR